MKLAENNGYSPRTKHIDVRHHYIRELLELKAIKLYYVNTKENIADLNTKPLGHIVHNRLVEKLLKEV